MWQLKVNADHFDSSKEETKPSTFFTAFKGSEWVSSENKLLNWTWHGRLPDLLQRVRNTGGGVFENLFEVYYNLS